MAFGGLPEIKQINGINLANYHAKRESYNTIVYYKKKTPPIKHFEPLPNSNKTKKKSKKNNTVTKGQQTDLSVHDKSIQAHIKITFKDDFKEKSRKEPLKTVAKIPIIVPKSDDGSVVCYTIKTTKKRKTRDFAASARDDTEKKSRGTLRESKVLVETFRKETSFRTNSSSSTRCTVEDLQLNHTVCSSLSEASVERKSRAAFKNTKKTRTNDIPESIEALATGIGKVAGDTKVKIHVMNDHEKAVLTDSIRVPVIQAIESCVEMLMQRRQDNDTSIMQVMIERNMNKLDSIIHKLNTLPIDISKAIASGVAVSTKNIEDVQPFKPKSMKASALEGLSEDVQVMDPNSSTDDHGDIKSFDQNKANAVGIVQQMNTNPENASVFDVESKGENNNGRRPNYTAVIPSRFCWTTAQKT